MARQPRPKRITRKALQPGDVLLSYGQEPVSRLIRFLGGGSYSHAALWDGKHIVETYTDDVISLVPLSAATDAQRYVDVYRWRTLQEPVRFLGGPGYPSKPVTRCGKAIRGLGFAKDEAVMLGLIVAISDLPDNGKLRDAVRVALSSLDDWIHDHLGSGKRAMICTETVCTAFWEADRTRKRRYAIHIRAGISRMMHLLQAAAPGPTLQAIASPAVAEAEELRRIAATLFLQATGQEFAARPGPSAGAPMTMGIAVAPSKPELRKVGGRYVPLGCVTPHDLQHSPNLQLFGRVGQQPAKKLPISPLGLLIRALRVP